MLQKQITRPPGFLIVEYTFEDAGDAVPVHAHSQPDHHHLTIVTHGSIRVDGDPSIAGAILTPGDIRDWPLGLEHGFTALEPGSRLANVFKT